MSHRYLSFQLGVPYCGREAARKGRHMLWRGAGMWEFCFEAGPPGGSSGGSSLQMPAPLQGGPHPPHICLSSALTAQVVVGSAMSSPDHIVPGRLMHLS